MLSPLQGNMLMKNSYDTIEDLNGDLPFCAVVPQPTATLRAPICSLYWL